MNINLSSNFISAMQLQSRAPIQLAVVHFSFGDIYLSDRDITINGVHYVGLIEDWGSLDTASEDYDDLVSETLQMSISIWNGGQTPFSNYFSIDDPTNVQIDIYQTFEGLLDEDKAIIGNFVIQDPIHLSESSRLISLDLVSINMRYQSLINTTLSNVDWPKALSSDVNKGIDLIIGDAGPVKTLCAKAPVSCTLKGSILKLPTIVNTYENLSDLNFAQSGYIVIEDEVMSYSSRDNDTFIVTARGQLSTAIVEHSDGSEILEYITDHTFIIGKGPLASVSNVKVNDYPIDPSKYTLHLDQDPALIIFPKQPYYVSLSKGARSVDLDFDSVSGNNHAQFPHYAYSAEEKSNGALISKNYTPLAIVQNTVSPDIGEVVRVFLSVEHWANQFYANDIVEVHVTGIGKIGTLSRPNSLDDVTLDGEIDIDHSHDHETSGSHAHANTGVGLNTQDPTHLHTGVITGPTIVHGGNVGLPVVAYIYSTTDSAWQVFSFSSLSGINSQRLRVRFSANSIGKVQLRQGAGAWGAIIMEWTLGSVTVDQIVNIYPGISPQYSVTLKWHGGGVVGGHIQINEMTMTTVLNGGINNAGTGVQAQVTAQPSVLNQNVDTNLNAINKLVDDVNPLATENRRLLNIATTKASRTLTEKFDLTQYLETISWPWLTNREVQLRYVGTTNSAIIVIVHTFFEVEYRERVNQISNDVYCNPVGTINSRPDKVIEYLLNSILGIPLASMDSIWHTVAVWDDELFWDDELYWADSGSTSEFIGDTSFIEAGSKFSYLNYRIDGVISAVSSVQDAIKNICLQSRSRLIWVNDKVKLAVRSISDDWFTVKEILPNDIQLKSLQIKKESLLKVCNDIDLFYDVNRLSQQTDETSYNKSISRIDNDSVIKHGQRKDNSRWCFDLVRSDSMAEDLANYYLWRYGEPASFYLFNTYLPQFDLEKEDVIRITSKFVKTISLPVRVIYSNRYFGSGKLRRINTLQIVSESIRHKLLIEYIDDFVRPEDVIDIDFGTLYESDDAAYVSDILSIGQTVGVDDSINISDSLITTSFFRPTLTDAANVTEELAVAINFVLNDSVSISDNIILRPIVGFGAGAFGLSPFGSNLIVIDSFVEDVYLSEEVIVTLY